MHQKLRRMILLFFDPQFLLVLQEKLVIPILERKSYLKAGEDFKISFCPERTVEGNALQELETLPQIVGGFDKKSF